MQRRNLQQMMQGLGQGLAGIGQQMMHQQQAAPMTGTGIKEGNVPPIAPLSTQSGEDKGDAASMGSSSDDLNPDTKSRQPGDYIVPSRPSTLAQESSLDNAPGMQLLRRRLDPGSYGRRRIG